MRRVVLSGVLLAAAVTAGQAQVGYEPSESPYRDITKSKSLTFLVGYFGGSGGARGVGPHNGLTVGGRFDIALGGSFQLGFGFYVADLERNIVRFNLDSIPSLETIGPIPQQVLMFDFTAQFNLTGAKSWKRLAPYFSASVGLALGEDSPLNTGDFVFGNKIYLAPTLGTRVMLSQTFHLRLEARAQFWKLSYPPAFTFTASAGQWVVSPWLQAGLGVAF
jgi:hypothetical protein